jgi:site-specific recombinase XerD
LKLVIHEDHVNWGGRNKKEKDKREKLRNEGKYVNENNPEYRDLNRHIEEKLRYYKNNFDKTPNRSSFISFIDDHINSLNKKNKHGTQQNYQNFKRYLTNYLGTIKKIDLKFHEITEELLVGFQNYLSSIEVSNSTNNNNIYKFKKLYEISIPKYHIPTYDIFSRFNYLKIVKKEKPSLSIDEVETLLYSEPLRNPIRDYYKSIDREGYETISPLEKYRQMFIFQIFSGGLRVSDILFLQWSDLRFNEKEMFFEIRSFKTNDPVKIRVNHILVNVLKNFINKSEVFTTYFHQSDSCPKCGSDDYKHNGSYPIRNGESRRKTIKCSKCGRSYSITKHLKHINFFNQWNKEDFKFINIETKDVYPIHFILEIKEIKNQIHRLKGLKLLGKEIEERDSKDINRLKIFYHDNQEILDIINDPHIYDDQIKELEEIYNNSGLRHWWDKFKTEEMKYYFRVFSEYKKKYPNRFIFDCLNDKLFINLNKNNPEKHFKDYLSQEQYTNYQSSSKRYNGSLKQVSKKLNLSIELSTHVGRHTFTRIGLLKNVSLYSLSKLLQHKSIKTTQIYLKDFDEEIIYKELDDKVFSGFNF